MYKTNKFCDTLEIEKGVTAIIGSGGKTSLMLKLAEELREKGRVIVCTTTHILLPEGVPFVSSIEEVEAYWSISRSGDAGLSPVNDDGTEAYVMTGGEKTRAVKVGSLTPATRVLCVGKIEPETGKVISLGISEERLLRYADYVLVEADGSKHLPLKSHNANEPVIPENVNKVILVIGASGIDKPIKAAVHRPELFAEAAGVTVDTEAGTELITKVICSESKSFGTERLTIFINQADEAEFDLPRKGDCSESDSLQKAEKANSNLTEKAEKLAKELCGAETAKDIFYGSVKKGFLQKAKIDSYRSK